MLELINILLIALNLSSGGLWDEQIFGADPSGPIFGGSSGIPLTPPCHAHQVRSPLEMLVSSCYRSSLLLRKYSILFRGLKECSRHKWKALTPAC